MLNLIAKHILVIAIALVPTASFAQAPDTLDVYGVWRTLPNDGLVRVSDCGDGTPCGTIIRVDPEAGLGEFDTENPDPALRRRTIVGLTLLSDFRRGRDSWRSGRIYDPQSGRSYRSFLKKLPDGRLQVQGCFGPFCQTQRWEPIRR